MKRPRRTAHQGQPWTREDDELVLALSTTGRPYRQIATRLRRPEAECRARAKALRNPPPTGTRRCLMCRRDFRRERGIFVCRSCKATDVWQGAA